MPDARELGPGGLRLEMRFDSIRFYFGDVLHLHLKRSALIGLQSWRSDKANFSIEFTFGDGATITTEYDDVEKWKFILREIEPFL